MKFNKTISIGNSIVSDDSPTFIIAEAGVNHGGDINMAKKLIDVAAAAGADAVKFQAFRTENLILKNVEKAEYQKVTTGSVESQYEMLKKLELSKHHYTQLKAYCNQKGIIFLITPFDEGSLQELEEVGLDAYKIASTDATNLPLLRKIAATHKPLIFSTGMCYLEEISKALEEIYPVNKDVILLQCVANYPIRDEDANLNVINLYKNTFDIIVGYSDHSVGLGASLYAIPMGAKVLEKHFTLDKTMEGPDHNASLTPEELVNYIKEVRRVEKYLGKSQKEPTDAELNTRKTLQKCLVTSRNIDTGEKFTLDNIIAKRTGGIGISPLQYRNVIGKTAKRDFQANEIIDVE